MKKLAVLLAIFALSACKDVSGRSYRFTGQVTRLEEPTEPFGISATNFGGGAVSVQGLAVTDCYFDLVDLDGDKEGEILIVHLLPRPQEPCTDTRPRQHSWIGIFSALRRGAYTVRVIDELDGTPETIYDAPLNVR
ncbi:MAG TPA: hypothetical protein VHG91_02205 [Longimicrobium sp.]|nr:hypothetical protein [Longimicrobium sp.]